MGGTRENAASVLSRPTKLIATGMRGRERIWRGDDEKWYTVRELSVAAGIKVNTLEARFSKFGWDHDQVLCQAIRGHNSMLRLISIQRRRDIFARERLDIANERKKSTAQPPKKVIGEPYRRLRSKLFLFPCNNGFSYTLRELAEICGVSYSTLYNRWSEHGWAYQGLLARKGSPRKPKSLPRSFLPASRARKILDSIASPGSLERKYLGG